MCPIMSSGESKESENLISSGDTQTCGALLCDSPLDSNTASNGIIKLEYVDHDAEDDNDTPIDSDDNVCASYGVLISDCWSTLHCFRVFCHSSHI